MSTFDDESASVAHNACSDACRRLLVPMGPEFRVERCHVTMDGCDFELTVIAEIVESGRRAEREARQ